MVVLLFLTRYLLTPTYRNKKALESKFPQLGKYSSKHSVKRNSED